MAQNTYSIEYAKTGRSGCKEAACKKSGENKIDSGELRIGKISPNPFNEGEFKTDWYHPACWFTTQSRMKAGSKKVTSTDDLEGFDKLTADDKSTVEDLIAGKGAAGAKKKPAKKAATKKRKGSDDDEDDEEEEKPKKKKAAPKKKAAAASDDDEDEDEKPKKKKAKTEKKPEKKEKAKKKKGSDDDDDEDEKPKKKSGGGGGGATERYEMDSKFWEVTVDGSDLTVTFGKIGSNGQTQVKPFANAAAAEKEKAKLVKQKTGKGYELA